MSCRDRKVLFYYCQFQCIVSFPFYSSVGFSHDNETDECELYAKQNSSVLLNSTNTKVYLKKGGNVDCIKLDNCPRMSLDCKDMVCSNCIELVGNNSFKPTNNTLLKVLPEWGPGYEISLDIKLNTEGIDGSIWDHDYDIFQFTIDSDGTYGTRIPMMRLKKGVEITNIEIRSLIGSNYAYHMKISNLKNGTWYKIVLKQIKEVIRFLFLKTTTPERVKHCLSRVMVISTLKS